METRIADCPLGAKCEEVKLEAGKQILYQCPWYVKVRGLDPNTGEELDNWKCAIAWIPVLSINAANEARKGAAATESFRNEVAAHAGRATSPQSIFLSIGKIDKPATLEETPPALLREL